MARLKAPKNCGGFSFGGNEVPLKKGHIEVNSPEAIEAALNHGFTYADDDDEEVKPPKSGKGAKTDAPESKGAKTDSPEGEGAKTDAPATEPDKESKGGGK